MVVSIMKMIANHFAHIHHFSQPLMPSSSGKRLGRDVSGSSLNGDKNLPIKKNIHHFDFIFSLNICFKEGFCYWILVSHVEYTLFSLYSGH